MTRVAAMSNRALLASLAFAVALVGCNVVAKLAGVPLKEVVSVAVVLPAGILVGDSVQATATATDNAGNVTNSAPATWRSSDATVASVDAQGWVTGLIGGR